MESLPRREFHNSNPHLNRQPDSAVRWLKAPTETQPPEETWRLDPQTFQAEKKKTSGACRAAEGVLCEHCLSQLVLSKNPLLNKLQDIHFTVSQFFIGIFGTVGEILTSPITLLKKLVVKPLAERKIRTHTHKPGQHLCEQCMSEFHSSGTQWLDEAKEYSYIAGRGLLLVMEMMGIFVIGCVMLILTVFPHVVKPKTPEEREAEALREAAKDAEFSDKKEEQLDWQDQQHEEFHKRKRSVEDARQRDHEQLKEEQEKVDKYNKTVHNINISLPHNEALDVGIDVLVDDQKVKALNGTAKAVEDGKEDPKKLQQMADDLLSQRREKAQKDARRNELDAKARENEWKAKQLAADADRKAREAKYDEARDLAAKADAAWREAKGAYGEYNSV
jgi:hypothetical protein